MKKISFSQFKNDPTPSINSLYHGMYPRNIFFEFMSFCENCENSFLRFENDPAESGSPLWTIFELLLSYTNRFEYYVKLK